MKPLHHLTAIKHRFLRLMAAEKKPKDKKKPEAEQAQEFCRSMMAQKAQVIPSVDVHRLRRDLPPLVAVRPAGALEGDRNHPIAVDEYQSRARAGDRSHPITIIDDLDDDDDDLILQVAIEESLLEVKYQNNPKGKKPIEVEFIELDDSDEGHGYPSKLEYGESSREAPEIEPELFCDICMESKQKIEIFDIPGCHHSYCNGCVSQYVEAKLDDNVVTIGCPYPGCKGGNLGLETCRFILPPDVYVRWGNALCEAVVPQKAKFYCPFKDCSALLIDEGEGEVITVSECPHCNRLFCAQCRVPWHLGVTCEAYRKLGKDERGREDLMLRQLAEQCQWQRCPKCKFYVERIDGCMFMACRCGYGFCYGCASAMKKELHYCYKCKR